MRAVLGLIGLAGCQLTFSSAVGGSSDAPSAPCTTTSLVCIDESTLRECTVIGSPPIDFACGWGCSELGIPHCKVLLPSGGAASFADTINFSDVGNVTLSAPTTIDGTTGTISGITSGFTHTLRAGTGTQVALFRFKSLAINAPVTLTGTVPIVFIVDGPIDVNVVVTAKGPCGVNDAATTPGPGGFAGGMPSQGGAGTGGGAIGTVGSGGGGGGHGGVGGNGGVGMGGAPGSGGQTFGTPTIDLLRGGGGGGASVSGGGSGRGGGGGGAVQLISNTRIAIATAGGIDAGGCGGDSGQGAGDDSGGGGGAGGAILLEAPTITVSGKLAVNGGGGGAGDDAGAATGANGALGRVPAPGATAGTAGGPGGVGAAAATFSGAVGPADAQHAGGGGGGIGRIRFNTKTGAIVFSGEMSPSLMDANSKCTAGPASLQ